MSCTLEHIQEELDEVFPGLRLEYQEMTGYWIITDQIYSPDGSPASGLYYRCPYMLLPFNDGELTNRRIQFFLEHPDTGFPIEPTLDNVMNTLYRAFNGGDMLKQLKQLEDVERSEDDAREYHEGQARAAMLEAAKAAWDRQHGRVVATQAGVSEYSKTDQFIADQLMQSTMQDEEMMKSAVMRGAGVRRTMGHVHG